MQYARDSAFDEDAFRGHVRRVEELWVFESAWVQEQVIGAARPSGGGWRV